jgi:hypothetical protein
LKRVFLPALLCLGLATGLSARKPLPPDPIESAAWDCGGCSGPVTLKVTGWPQAKGEAGYNVYLSEASGTGYRKANDKPVRAKTLLVKGVVPAWRYFVVLTTVTKEHGKTVESKPSEEFSVVAPGVLLPPNQADGTCRGCKGSTFMTVSGWAPNALRFHNLYMSATSGKDMLRVNDKPFNQPAVRIKGVVPGTKYYFTLIPVERKEGQKDQEGKPEPEFSMTAPAE